MARVGRVLGEAMTLICPVSMTKFPLSNIPATRQSLLIELGKRSDDAWSEFLIIYERSIYRLCRSKGLQDADAEDVTQEVLAAVHQRIATWDHDASRGSFRAWLMRVARNISVDSITDRARRATSADSQIEELLGKLPDGPGDSQAEFDLEYRHSLFEWAAAAVKSEVRDITWQAFQLTAVQGLKAEDVAARLKIPVGSVYTAKCRVVSRIRAKVAELQDDTNSPVDC